METKGKQLTVKLNQEEVGIIRRALEIYRGSVGDSTPVETTMVFVRFRSHDDRMKQGY